MSSKNRASPWIAYEFTRCECNRTKYTIFLMLTMGMAIHLMVGYSHRNIYTLVTLHIFTGHNSSLYIFSGAYFRLPSFRFRITRTSRTFHLCFKYAPWVQRRHTGILLVDFLFVALSSAQCLLWS